MCIHPCHYFLTNNWASYYYVVLYIENSTMSYYTGRIALIKLYFVWLDRLGFLACWITEYYVKLVRTLWVYWNVIFCQQAWEETFRNWEASTKLLTSFPKAKLEEGQVEPFHRSAGKRRASHQNPEHELEVARKWLI